MDGEQARQGALLAGRYGVVYPAVAAAGVALASRVGGASFGTVGFLVFAAVAVVTGIGAVNSPSSSGHRAAGSGLVGSASPGERWADSDLLKLVLFELGLAVVLTVHALRWAGGA